MPTAQWRNGALVGVKCEVCHVGRGRGHGCHEQSGTPSLKLFIAGCGAVTGVRPIPTPPSSPSLRSLKNGNTLSVAACWEANNPNPRSHTRAVRLWRAAEGAAGEKMCEARFEGGNR